MRTPTKDWRVKAGLQKAMSATGFGAQLNFYFQRYITHTVPLSEADLRAKIDHIPEHLVHYKTYATSTPLADAQFFEFGAGWDFHVAFCLYAYGVEHQRVVDLERHARLATVADVVGCLIDVADGQPKARLSAAQADATGDLDSFLRAFGIVYDAPADARATGLPPASVDCITSTSVIEHIPAPEIRAILDECRRILRPGGICSFFIDAGDHYARFDRSIPTNNFLRYVPKQWQRINSAVFAQNRLRYSDYLAMFHDAGYEVLHDFHRTPGWGTTLGRGEVASEFSHYDEEDLTTSAIYLVVRPS